MRKARFMTMSEASRIFRAMNGDKEAQARTQIDEVRDLLQADTFSEFLLVNRIADPTEVQRHTERVNEKY